MPGKSSLSSDKRQTSASKNEYVIVNNMFCEYTITVNIFCSRNNEEGGKKILIWPEWTDAELNAEKWVSID